MFVITPIRRLQTSQANFQEWQIRTLCIDTEPVLKVSILFYRIVPGDGIRKCI